MMRLLKNNDTNIIVPELNLCVLW